MKNYDDQELLILNPMCKTCNDSACDPNFEELVPCPDCAAKPYNYLPREFYVEHKVLRKALGMYGIAAPESDEELGSRMDSYAIKVIKAVAKLPFPSPQDVSGLVLAVKKGVLTWDDYLHSGGGDPSEHAKFIASVHEFLKLAEEALAIYHTHEQESTGALEND